MNMNNIEDIEQILKPQCEFKASERLKNDVLEKARQEIRPHHSVRLWPWVAAACVAGVIMMLLMPPKDTSVEESLVAKAELAPATEVKQADSKPETEQVIASVETPKPRKAVAVTRKPRQEAHTEESVQMSEETRLALMMASLNEDVPHTEEINPEEEIRQLRKRGERLISMFEVNDK
jgi:hypothetical protein